MPRYVALGQKPLVSLCRFAFSFPVCCQICGIATFTEVLNDVADIVHYKECLEFTEGFDDVLCFEDTLDEFYNLTDCEISVNGEYCQSCEVVTEPCGLQAYEGQYRVADCTNVDEIGYEVNECTHTDHTGILSSFFTSYHHLGVCNVGGSLSFTDNSTDADHAGGQDRTEGLCGEEASFQEEFWPEYERSCSCTDNEDGTTTLACTDGCESCDPDSKVCGLYSFFNTFDESDYLLYFASQFQQCFEYTKGEFKGDLVCFESFSDSTSITRNYFFFEPGPCRLSVNGVDCGSCVIEDKDCDDFAGPNFYLTADCTNNDIGQIVDECDDDTYHDLLAFIYHFLYDIGSCDIPRADNSSTIPPLKPPKPNGNETSTPQPTDETSKAGQTKAFSFAITLVSLFITAFTSS